MAAPITLARRDSSNVCATTAMYRSPQAGAVVDSSQPVNFAWATNCNPAPQAIDIYLFAPALTPPKIQVWYGVKFSSGSYKATLKPSWWGSAPNVNLQYAFVESNTPSFMSTIPPGPTFSVNYNASASPAASAANPGLTPISTTDTQGFTTVNNYNGGGLSKGKLAAAVLMPILVVAAGLAAYIIYSRRKESKKRQRWSQAVDRRMSVISNDWHSITPAGAAARRSSVATNRMSSFGGPRPASTFNSAPEMQARLGTRPPTFASGDRVSRVSFAADPRYSVVVERIPPVPSRPAHYAHGSDESIPPALPPKRGYYPDDDLALAPEQARGALSLSDHQIQAHAIGGDDESPVSPNARASYFDAGLAADALMLPAITLMRTGGTQNELLLAPQPVTPPSAKTTFTPPPAPAATAVARPTSPPVAAQPQQMFSPVGPMPLLSMNMSPDAMMRAYAQQRAAGGMMAAAYAPDDGAYGGIAYPAVAHTSPSNGMRTLYTPGMYTTSPASAQLASLQVNSNNPFRQSVAGSEESHYPATDMHHEIGTAE